MSHIFFIYSSVEGYLGFFHVLATVNRAAMNIVVHDYFELRFSQGICPVAGLLDGMVVLFLVFIGTSILFSIVAVSIYIPTNSVGGFHFLHTLSSIYYLQIFGDGHSDQCEVILHCSFDLHFSNDE